MIGVLCLAAILGRCLESLFDRGTGLLHENFSVVQQPLFCVSCILHYIDFLVPCVCLCYTISCITTFIKTIIINYK